MNEKYAEIINGLTETLKETKDFVLEQAPDVAKQLLVAEMIKLKFQLIMCAFFSAVSLGVFMGAVFYHNDDSLICIARFIVGCISFLCTLGSMSETATCVSQLISVTVAPKAFLLKKFKSLLP